MHCRSGCVRCCAVTFCLAFLLTFVIQRVQAKEPAQPKASPAKASVDLQPSAGEFEKAFNARDAKGIAAQFTENAEVVDADGNLVRGQKQIGERFAALFKEFPEAQIRVQVTSLRQLTQSVALEEGISAVKLGVDEPISRNPYTVVLLKQKEKWLVASVRDFPEEANVSAHEQLQQLAWLVGEWVDESPEGRVETKCQWSDDGNYLLQDYVIKSRAGSELKGTQRIGWDPLKRTIRSWAFDQSGAFVEATWSPVEGSWMIRADGVIPSGHAASAIRIVTPLSKDSYQLESRNVVVVDQFLPGETVLVVRRPPAPQK